MCVILEILPEYYLQDVVYRLNANDFDQLQMEDGRE